MTAVTDSRRAFDQRVISVALLARLAAIAVALAGHVGSELSAPLLGGILTLSAVSFVQLYFPQVRAVMLRHPLTFVLDVLVCLAIVAVLGVESPLVLATFSTALLIGVMFPLRTAIVVAVILVAGYLLALLVGPGGPFGFMTTLGVPTLYCGMVATGAAVQDAYRREVRAARLLAETLQTAATADERARLAREMHDSLGKTLHGVALAAQTLPTWVDRDPELARRHAQLLAEGANQAAVEARSLLNRMRVDQPDRPLAQVLGGECAAWQEQHGVTCAFRAECAVDVATDARYELLAVVGEALENVARHAQARHVDVVLRGDTDGGVTVEVRDDGVGFAPGPDGTGPRGHYGLVGMRERAERVGAALQITSSPGGGTTVSLRIPAEECIGV